MQDGKTGGSRWVPDIREDEITEFQEQNGDETATYKAVNVHPIISRVLDKLAFFRTHVSAVWYNKLANKTVKDKLDEIDTSISSLNSRLKYTQFEITSENESVAFTGFAENGCVMVRANLAPGASGNILFSVPQQFAPRTTVAGAYAVNASSADAGKLNGAYINQAGAGGIWLNESINGAENVSFVYPLKS